MMTTLFDSEQARLSSRLSRFIAGINCMWAWAHRFIRQIGRSLLSLHGALPSTRTPYTVKDSYEQSVVLCMVYVNIHWITRHFICALVNCALTAKRPS